MKVALLQVPSGDAAVASGGSQVVAQTLARQMATLGFRVTLFCGYRPGEHPQPSEGEPSIVPAFTVTPTCLTSGVPPIRFEEDVRAQLADCAVAFMFDRVFPVPPGVPRVLVLGTVGYDFAVEAVVSGGWDAVVVPSTFMRTELAWLLNGAGAAHRLSDVVVVPNPVRLWPEAPPTCAVPPVANRPLRLLFPHRADTRKGPREAVALLALVRAAAQPAVLQAVVDRSETAEPGFYERLVGEARRLGVERHVELFPWRAHEAMRELYRGADLTVCLGSLAEGFGLAVRESLICGTPVVTHARGAELEHLPDPSGCFVCTSPITAKEAARLVRSLGTGELRAVAEAAAIHIRRRHGDRRIASAYLATVGVAIKDDKHPAVASGAGAAAKAQESS